ncbi:MAG: aminotransferase class IV [Clostridium sp.]
MDLFKPEIAFGLTPFETIYFNNKKPERLKKHYYRLLRASRVLNVLYKESFKEFEKCILEYLESVDIQEGVLKAILINDKLEFTTRETGYTKEKFKKGMSLTISKGIRNPKNILIYFKNLNYGENVIEDRRSKARGFDGCIFKNTNGYICETSYANIFFRKGNELYTPHLSCGILKGVMRDDIICFARENGYTISKCFLTEGDIATMDECFISNSVCGPFPVSSINNIDYNSRRFVDSIISSGKFNRGFNII